MTIILRREEERDHRPVEGMTREAFWGQSGPRCDEHLLVHRLRGAGCFVPELDVVAELDGTVVGHVVWSHATVVGDGITHPVLTFGPLSVDPSYQGRGVGDTLMRHTLAEAARLGHRAVVFYGHPDHYPRFGFRPGAEAGITAPGGATFDALMAMPLVLGGLDGVRGEFHEDPAFHLELAEVEEFDATFPPKEPAARTALGAIEGRVPGAVVEALLAHGLTELEQLFRFSSAEAAAWDGVGAAGAVALRAAVRPHGIRWGAPDPGGVRAG
ncbi:MAG TPA: N-acetyltransferase [Cellulomonadaceae bacterium]|nr:N-acetyltransferase [Cellulomonadaceae bacterium]